MKDEKKMSSIFVAIAIAGILILSALYLSKFETTTIPVISTITKDAQSEHLPSEIITKVEKIIIEEKLKEVVVEKITYKDNPELQKRINALTIELKNEKESCKKQFNDFTKLYIADLQKAKEKYDNLLNTLPSLSTLNSIESNIKNIQTERDNAIYELTKYIDFVKEIVNIMKIVNTIPTIVEFYNANPTFANIGITQSQLEIEYSREYGNIRTYESLYNKIYYQLKILYP